MSGSAVTFLPIGTAVTVRDGTTLLAAAAKAGIHTGNLCGGEGLCGRCKVRVATGTVDFTLTGNISTAEAKDGYVLACLAKTAGNVTVELPDHMIGTGTAADGRFADQDHNDRGPAVNAPVRKLFLSLEPTALDDPSADSTRISAAAAKALGLDGVDVTLPVLQRLPQLLRQYDFKVTVSVFFTGARGLIIALEGGDTSDRTWGLVYDLGTTTLVVHLVDLVTGETEGTAACFSSQGTFGREVTGRMIAAEKNGMEPVRQCLVDDMNRLAQEVCAQGGCDPGEVVISVAAGNTPVCHFLLGLPTDAIRRTPYVPVTARYPVLSAAETGLALSRDARVMVVPGISGWVGGDITAGIAATGIIARKDLTLFIDIGTNGEVVLGNDEWLVTTSASAGPALEGASVACGMRAETGAVEAVWIEDDAVRYRTIADVPARGLCGSGILDLLAILVKKGICDRSGMLHADRSDAVREENGIKKYVLVPADAAAGTPEIYLSEKDIENLKTAKAAIYAALKILLVRLDMTVDAVDRFVIGGAFGKHLNLEHAVAVGLLPPVPKEKVVFAGNTSLYGAKVALLDRDRWDELQRIAANATYYDLMGADDYVDQFQQALFLPHTNIEEFA